MNDTIFDFLRSYTPSAGRDPKEDYLTQLFAWLLINVKGLDLKYCEYLLKKTANSTFTVTDSDTIAVDTQRTWSNGKRIDLLITVNGTDGFICEHKIYSMLSPNQITNYSSMASSLGLGQFHTVLVTLGTYQWTQNADVRVLWSSIYQDFLQKELENYANDSVHYFMLDQTISFMQNNSLGTYGEITSGAIAGYWETFGLKNAVNNIIGGLRVREWETDCPDLQRCNPNGYTEYPTYYKEKWGRVGLEMYSKWKPGIFVGILWDYTNHKIDPLNKENGGPDVVILVDMLESDYSKITNSQACADYLEKLNQNHGDFDLIEYSKIPGYWRVVVLRKSLSDVLQGKQNRGEQEEALYKTFCEGINFLTKDGDLGRLG
jgi:hypothetical protein